MVNKRWALTPDRFGIEANAPHHEFSRSDYPEARRESLAVGAPLRCRYVPSGNQ